MSTAKVHIVYADPPTSVLPMFKLSPWAEFINEFPDSVSKAHASDDQLSAADNFLAQFDDLKGEIFMQILPKPDIFDPLWTQCCIDIQDDGLG